ncbi:MAG: hypothetical protein L6Q97_06515 [Thermoanaerobaculia bacterium]|nr:hypothetical protein [Thermoanaerobaculia bacterium]
MNRKIETILLIVIAAVYFLYLLLRAWYIPMTQDEVATCYNHVTRGIFDLMTYQREAVPNNHILNTLAIKLLAGIFGMGQMVARIPALAGGLLYLFGAGALARLLGSTGWLRLLWFVLLLGNPFMAEFFALARGYGISIALMTVAVYFAWKYLENARPKYLGVTLVFAGLSVMANFTILNVYLPLILLLLLNIRQQLVAAAERRKASKILAAGILILLILCALPVYRMQAGDELKYWGSAGFFRETLAPLVRSSIMDHPYLDGPTVPVLAKLIVVFCLTAWAVAVWRWGNRQWRMSPPDPLVFAGFLLAGTVTVNLLQNFFLDVPFLNPRTAVFLYPLFALQLIAVGELLWRQWRYKALYFAVPLLIFTLINFDNNRNIRESYEWSYDRGTFTVFDYIKKAYETEGRTTPFTIDANWLLLNSLQFHNEFSRPPYRQWVTTPQYHGDQPPKGDTDFFYTATREDIEALRNNYEPVLTVEEGRYVLMRRKRE